MVASRRARFRFARPDHCSSTTSTRLNFRVAPLNEAKYQISISTEYGHSCPSLLRLKFDLTGTPRLVEPRLKRAVETQQSVPAFAGYGLNPVRLPTRRCLGAEVNVYGAVGICLQSLGLAAHRGPVLIRLQHRAGLIVVEDYRPEVLYRNVLR